MFLLCSKRGVPRAGSALGRACTASCQCLCAHLCPQSGQGKNAIRFVLAAACMRVGASALYQGGHASEPLRALCSSSLAASNMLLQPSSRSKTHTRKSSTASSSMRAPGSTHGVPCSGAFPTHTSSMHRPAITCGLRSKGSPSSGATRAAALCHGDLSSWHLAVRLSRQPTTLRASRAPRVAKGNGCGEHCCTAQRAVPGATPRAAACPLGDLHSEGSAWYASHGTSAITLHVAAVSAELCARASLVGESNTPAESAHQRHAAAPLLHGGQHSPGAGVDARGCAPQALNSLACRRLRAAAPCAMRLRP